MVFGSGNYGAFLLASVECGAVCAAAAAKTRLELELVVKNILIAANTAETHPGARRKRVAEGP